MRGRIPELEGEKAQRYIHNTLYFAATRFRHDASVPASEIAYMNRKMILESQEPSEIEKHWAVVNEMGRRGQTPHIIEPGGASYSMTSWAGAWRGLDFSSALKSTGNDTKEGKKLNLLVSGHSLVPGTPSRCELISTLKCLGKQPSNISADLGVIMCRTDEGFWVDIGLPQAAIAAIKELLAKDPQLENL